MNGIDDILSQYGIPSIIQVEESQENRMEEMEESNVQEHGEALQEGHESQEDESQAQNDETDGSLSEDNINDILQEHGFGQDSRSVDEYLQGMDEEEHEDIEDNDTNEVYEENHDEGHDDIIQDPEWEMVEDAITETTDEAFEEGLLPLNSPTLLIDDSTSRFSGAEWYGKIRQSKVIIGGMGGISSHLAFNIARMSPALIVMYDDDVVETANMSGQLYGWNDIGKAKVNAIEGTLRNYTSAVNIYAVKEKFTRNSDAGDIMMCGFDNMFARETFFHSWRRHLEGKTEEEKRECLFLDGRLSMSCMQILCIEGNDDYNIDRYEREFLFSDAEADENVCSMKQTTYLASMIGAMMTNLFTNHTANCLNPIIPYTLPFFTEYDAQYMIFKIEN